MTPTAEAIHALDGPALTRLALTLGLAPRGAYQSPYTQRQVWETTHQKWRPHLSVAQAYVALTALRQDGWELSLSSQANTDHEPCIAYGRVEVLRDGYVQHSVFWSTAPGSPEDTEALALLRCAVLARASMEEAPHA